MRSRFMAGVLRIDAFRLFLNLRCFAIGRNASDKERDKWRGHLERASRRAWQRMLSGRRLDLLDPSPFDVEIDDIAQGLARVARWNGQTRGDHAFSVAEHSSSWSASAQRSSRPGRQMAPRRALHDAPEYVIGDMISPFKAALGYEYKTFEARLEGAIHALRPACGAAEPPITR